MLGKVKLSARIVPHKQKKKEKKGGKLFEGMGFCVTIHHIQFYLAMSKIGNAAELG